MGKLTFNNGIEVNGYLIETDGRLFLYLYGISFADAFELLNDPENTKKIKSDGISGDKTARGYKELYTLTKEDGFVSAGLRK